MSPSSDADSSSASESSEPASSTVDLTTTRAKRRALVTIIQNAQCPVPDASRLANELINKFKWIAREIGLFLDIVRVIIAYVDRQESPGTEQEKRCHHRISELHPQISRIFEYASTRSEVASTLANIIEFHMTEAKSSDTNTLRYLSVSYLPLNPKREVIDPPMDKDSKSDRGFNHLITATALTPLKYRAKFERNKQAFMDKVNAGEVLITHKLFPSVMYPHGAGYDRDDISKGLFRSHVMIRAMRAIFHGPGSAFNGVRSASKSSQAEMHGMDRPTPQAVAYVALHVMFSLYNIENWSRAQSSTFNFIKFYSRVVKMFSYPEDEWSTETLDYLASQMPPLRPRHGKRKRDGGEDSSAEEGDESDDEVSLAMKQRAGKKQRDVEESEAEEENEHVDTDGGQETPPRSSSVAPPSPSTPPRSGRPRRPSFMRSPSHSPRRHSASPQHARRRSSADLMPPPVWPASRSQLADVANQLEESRQREYQGHQRSPTQEPRAMELGRRSTLRSRGVPAEPPQQPTSTTSKSGKSSKSSKDAKHTSKSKHASKSSHKQK